MKMKKVKGLAHLYQLAQKKKSITLVGSPNGWVGHQGRTPAAWAINWTGQMIHRLLPCMYVYEPKEKSSARRSTEDAQRPTAEGSEKE